MSCKHPARSLLLDGVVQNRVSGLIDYVRVVCLEDGCGELLHLTKRGTLEMAGGARAGEHGESFMGATMSRTPLEDNSVRNADRQTFGGVRVTA